MSILSVKNISKSFGKLDVLNDISFNVEQGEVISIIGPSGSGKSTLLRCINQFEKIDSGECEICGITMTKNDENGKAVYADNKNAPRYQAENRACIPELQPIPAYVGA